MKRTQPHVISTTPRQVDIIAHDFDYVGRVEYPFYGCFVNHSISLSSDNA